MTLARVPQERNARLTVPNSIRVRRVVLAVLFLRYVVFEDPDISKRINEERRQKRKRARSRSLAGDGLEALRTAEAKRLAGKDRKGKGKVKRL